MNTEQFEVDRMLLVSIDPDLGEKIERIIPSAEVVYIDHLLAGLLCSSQGRFDVAMILVSRQKDMDAALRNFKRVNPSTPILLLVDMFDEPSALNLTQRGLADDYLILPLNQRELEMTLRKILKSKSVRHIEPLAKLPYSRLTEKIPSGNGQSNPQQLIIHEIVELINSAEMGLKDLMERICWSGIFLCKAQAARMTLGPDTVHIGNTEEFDLTIPLTKDGKEIGKLELATSDQSEDCSQIASYIERLVPGLVRLVSSQGALQELANTDSLTGLANRRHLEQVIETLIGRAREERLRVTLVLFDFDDFKHYNDTYGHGAGDEILREAGVLLKRCIRSQDLAARYGGDEFAILLWDGQERRIPNSEHPRSAMAVMERFRKLLREHYFSRLGPQAKGALTISGGLASFPWDAPGAQELIERADEALLEAKRSGKDRIYLVGQGPESEKKS